MCIAAAIFEYEDEEHFQRENSKEDTDNVCHYSGLLSTESYSTDELKNKKI